MEFKVSSPKPITISFGEEKHQMRHPTVGEQEEFLVGLEDATKLGGLASFRHMLGWAEKLGLPAEVVRRFPQGDVFELLELVMGRKKKE